MKVDYLKILNNKGHGHSASFKRVPIGMKGDRPPSSEFKKKKNIYDNFILN